MSTYFSPNVQTVEVLINGAAEDVRMSLGRCYDTCLCPDLTLARSVQPIDTPLRRRGPGAPSVEVPGLRRAFRGGQPVTSALPTFQTTNGPAVSTRTGRSLEAGCRVQRQQGEQTMTSADEATTPPCVADATAAPGDPDCPFRSNRLHVCTRRDGRVIATVDDGVCWMAARAQLLGGERCSICHAGPGDSPLEHLTPFKGGAAHLGCVFDAEADATANLLRTVADAPTVALFELDDPGRRSWSRPALEGAAMADHFDLSPYDIHDGAQFVHFEDVATAEYVIVRVSDYEVVSRRRKLEDHQRALRQLGGTRQQLFPGRRAVQS